MKAEIATKRRLGAYWVQIYGYHERVAEYRYNALKQSYEWVIPGSAIPLPENCFKVCEAVIPNRYFRKYRLLATIGLIANLITILLCIVQYLIT